MANETKAAIDMPDTKPQLPLAYTDLLKWQETHCRNSEISRDTQKLNRVTELLDALKRELI